MWLKRVLVFLFVAGAVSEQLEHKRENCSPVVFNLPVVASNLAFARNPSNTEASVQDFLVALFTTPTSEFITGTHPINSTFALHGVYCTPQIHNQHSNTLQILIHGITYNSTLWSGFHFGSQYSWQHHSTSHGYHTLAIDRLGHGLNSRELDPTLTIQTPLHVEAHHQLVSTLHCSSSSSSSSSSASRSRPTTALGKPNVPEGVGRCFHRIIMTGHSYGSALIAAQARHYPSDADALILTGFSTYLSGTTTSLEFISASVHDPNRFRGVGYGYMTFKHKSDRDAFYLSGHYDERIAQVDWDTQDIVSTGEFASSSAEILWGAAKGYKGNVVIVTGVYDKEFCKPTRKECEEILKETGKTLFPDVKTVETLAVDETAHNWMLHFQGGKVMERVHGIVGMW